MGNAGRILKTDGSCWDEGYLYWEKLFKMIGNAGRKLRNDWDEGYSSWEEWTGFSEILGDFPRRNTCAQYVVGCEYLLSITQEREKTLITIYIAAVIVRI